MDNATIYSTPDDVEPYAKERLIYENAENALAHFVRLERHVIAPADKHSGQSPFGLADVVSPDPVIAMGIQPYMRLADYQKHSLLAGDFDLDNAGFSQHEIARLIWSCANTPRAIALGDAAWRVLQMLPVGERRHYPVPPLKLPQAPAKLKARRLFIINHGADDGPVLALAERAEAEGYSIVCSERLENPGHRRLPVLHAFCCPDAAIHIHLGHHDSAAKSFRLIDSWQSGRLAVQWVEPGAEAGYGGGTLLVEDAVNGFICHSIDAVLAMCTDLEQDPVLCGKFISAGHRAAEPLARSWSAIAELLLR